MTEGEKALLHEKIIERTKGMEELIARLEEETKPISPENAIGRISRMDAINNKSVSEATLRESKIRLGRLKSAIANIGDNDFGKCKMCKAEIPLGRLMIMPETMRCVSCARK
ncbi:MAG: DnaK suppressor protein [Sphingobacteriales bacterium]|jgi:DnaK suppressor protein